MKKRTKEILLEIIYGNDLNHISLLTLCSNGKIENKDAYELISDRDFYTYKLSKVYHLIFIPL